MSSLRSTQLFGILTKIVTLLFGVVQTAIILRFLSPAQFGVVGILVSLSSLVGVSQHIGITDAAIREIAVADSAERRAAIFWVSLWFRLLVTVPLSLLFVLCGSLLQRLLDPSQHIEHFSYLLLLSAIILVLQGIQGVVGGAYTGKLVFGKLYALQMITAFLNIPLFAVATYLRGVSGYFEGIIVSTLLFLVLLSVFLKQALGGTLRYPSFPEQKSAFRAILHTGIWTYIARLLSVAWQRVPLLVLGRFASPEAVGLFNVALTFGSKLVVLASALGEVNLAFLSTAFAEGREQFQKLARHTLKDVALGLLFAAAFLALFPGELLRLFAGPAYVGAAHITVLITWGYALFAFLDIATNTLFVPARLSQYRALVFAFLFCGTGVGMLVLPISENVLRSSSGVLLGSIFGVVVLQITSFVRLQLPAYTYSIARFSLPFLPLVLLSFFPSISFLSRCLAGIVCIGIASWMAFPLFLRHIKGYRYGT